MKKISFRVMTIISVFALMVAMFCGAFVSIPKGVADNPFEELATKDFGELELEADTVSTGSVSDISQNDKENPPEEPAEANHTDHSGWSVFNSTGGVISPGKYYLNSDVQLSTTVSTTGVNGKTHLAIKSGTVTLCLNGHVLRGNNTAQIICVEGTGSLILCDCNETTEHKYYIDRNGMYVFDDNGYNSATAENRGIIKGGVITGGNASYRAGALEVKTNSSDYVTYITGGTFAGNYSDAYQGVSCVDSQSVLVMTGGVMCGNYAKSDTSAVGVLSGHFIMTGGLMRDNHTPRYGAIISYSGAVIDIYGGTIEDNVSSSGGSNVSCYNSSTINIYGGNFGGGDQSFSTGSGGTITIQGGFFEDADMGKKTVANGIPIAEGQEVIDLGADAGRYRYLVSGIWMQIPSIEDWEYGNEPNAPKYEAVPGAQVKVEYKPQDAEDGEYKEYNILTSKYPTAVGKYIMRFTADYEDNHEQVPVSFEITRRVLTITGVQAKEREYNGSILVELSGGELQNIYNEEEVSFKLGSGQVDTADAGESKKVTTSIILTGVDAKNYVLEQPKDVTVNILPQTGLQLDTFELSAPAYVGMNLSDVEYTFRVLDKDGKPVEGTLEWKISVGHVGEENTQTVVFTPDSPNYAKTEFEVAFKGEYLSLTFNFNQIHEQLNTEITYNQNYSAEKIRIMFNEMFLNYLSENPDMADRLKNMTPKLDGQFVDEYDKNLEHVKTSLTIEVTFEEKTYTVKFDSKNDKDEPTEKTYYYGNYIIEPEIPENNGKAFLGWYWERPNEDGNGTSETKWNFEQDVVTGDITLYAKWLDVNYVVDHIEVTANREFNALETVGDGDLTVTVYLTADGGYTQKLELSWGEYMVKYASPDGLLHVKNAEFTVEYVYGGVTKSEKVTVKVNPLKIDTSELMFGNKSFEYDGKAHTIAVNGQLPPQISGVIYEYFKGGSSIGNSGATDVGVYTVKATFELVDSDYYAESMTATLTITRGAEEVTVKWDSNDYTYNGKEQHPKAHIFDSDGNVITDNLVLKYTYAKGDGVKAGFHTVQVSIEEGNYIITSGDTFEYEIAKKFLDVPLYNGEFVYDGQLKKLSDYLSGFNDSLMVLGGEQTGTNAGTYDATISLKDPANYGWEGQSGTQITIRWTIAKAKVIIEWEIDEYKYNGEVQAPKATVKVNGKLLSEDEIEYVIKLSGKVTESAIDAGEYTIGIEFDVRNYEITGQCEISFSIAKKQLTLPTFDEELVYDGTEKNVAEFLQGYDAKGMTLSGDKQKTNAGTYRVTIVLSDSKNYSWDAGTSVTLEWKIEKAHLTAEWDGFEFLYKDGTTYGPRVKNVQGITASDSKQVDYANDFIYKGDTEVGEVGSYCITVLLNGNAAWTANYILDGNTEWSYVVVPRSGLTIVTIEWDNTEFLYNGEVQHPNYKVLDKDGNDITNKVEVVIEGDYTSSKWAGEYTATLKVKDGNLYFVRDGAVCKYTISEGENGEGGITDPDNPNNPNNKPDNSDGDDGIVLPKNFPLWQIIVGGVSLLVGIIFYVRMGMNVSKTKKYKRDTENIQKSYSFAGVPILLLAGSYLGLSQNIWTVISCCLAGICILGFIAMLVTGHARKKAEQECEKALADKNAELFRRKEEEQRRRDDELKVVLMAMMGNRNGATSGGQNGENGPIYATGATVEEIVAKTITALQPLLLAERPVAHDETVTKLLEQQEKLISDQKNLIDKILDMQKRDGRSADEDDEDEEDDEDWDSESDEEEVKEITPVEIVSPNGEVAATEATVTKTVKLPANFRARLKISSEKNREAYVVLKNLLNSKKGITFRVSGRVEKIKYKGELIGVIGVATKHLKLWLALDPNAFDKKRYFQKDVSEKSRYAQVPMLIKIGSERAENRAKELLNALCEKYGIAKKRRYIEKNLQELAYTLKHNALLKMHKQEMLRENIHVHDVDIMTDEEAEQAVERRSITPLGEEKFATLKLDILDENFSDGQKITLELLKKKGLVGEEYNGYKVIAGTRLTKPLIVIANEFTTGAAKMLVLTGGRAILLVQPFQPKFS